MKKKSLDTFAPYFILYFNTFFKKILVYIFIILIFNIIKLIILLNTFYLIYYIFGLDLKYITFIFYNIITISNYKEIVLYSTRNKLKLVTTYCF